ncbi:hypothetical protein Bache_1863 [Bacteroides helcogenes P 36-108]|uniref:Uncharacterized protein n=1 Tax=Bacteroides helcogenes (strain ATCC 35417 / DSM 20613 / JCM 6297 / CCUG 15421 / P 36-108) TaxID=693979 RepID=E6SP71_BACT6|nr:hypothetical protein Bache_1863 [Bacteroides helcogenes P 36-108]
MKGKYIFYKYKNQKKEVKSPCDTSYLLSISPFSSKLSLKQLFLIIIKSNMGYTISNTYTSQLPNRLYLCNYNQK